MVRNKGPDKAMRSTTIKTRMRWPLYGGLVRSFAPPNFFIATGVNGKEGSRIWISRRVESE